MFDYVRMLIDTGFMLGAPRAICGLIVVGRVLDVWTSMLIRKGLGLTRCFGYLAR